MTAYDALAELAERELELVSAGDIDGLAELRAARDSLVGALPSTPPAAARTAIERAVALQARVSVALEQRLQATGGELRKLTQGRTAMAGYAPAVERSKLVDRAG